MPPKKKGKRGASSAAEKSTEKKPKLSGKRIGF